MWNHVSFYSPKQAVGAAVSPSLVPMHSQTISLTVEQRGYPHPSVSTLELCVVGVSLKVTKLFREVMTYFNENNKQKKYVFTYCLSHIIPIPLSYNYMQMDKCAKFRNDAI